MKKIISIISVIALLSTMFYLPVMAEDVNVAALNTQVRLSSNVNTNVFAYGFTDVAPSTHIVAEKGNGTHAHSGAYYKTFDADAMAAPMPVNGIYSEAASGGKSCVDFTAYTSIWGKFKALAYDASDRIYFSAYVSNLDGKSHGIGFMPSSGGVVMSPWFNYTFPSNRWTKLDVVYNPNVTYTFTVDGTPYTVNSVGKTIPSNGNLGYAVTSTNNAANAEKIWTPILALGDMTYNADSTYIIKSVKFGETRFYIDGSLEYACTGSYTYSDSGNNFYFYDAVPSRLTLNGIGSTSLSNIKFGKITNFDESTFDFCQPVISGVEGKYAIKGNGIYTKGSINKADITVPDGAVMKVYENAAATVANGYKYTEVAGDTIAIGNLVTIQENANGGDRITYEVKKDSFNEYSYTGTELAASSLGNVTATYVGGVAGKDADDTAVRLLPVATTTDPFIALGYGMSSADLAKYNGYLHISYNLLVDGAKSTTKIKMTSAGGNIVAGNTNATAVTGVLNNNQWNRVDVVLYLEGGKVKGTDNNKTNGTSKMYVNGVLKSEVNTFLGGYHKDGRFCDALRVGFTINADPTQSESMYIDDYKAYCSYSEPVVPDMPEAITGNIGDTVASVAAKGAKVFSDVTFRKQATEDAVLKNGNIILTVEDDTYVYYQVLDNDIKHLYISGGAFESSVRFASDWTNTGIGGKSSDDVSLKLTKHSHESDSNYVNLYPQFTYNRADDAKKYVVIALNLYVPSESKFSSFGIYSQQHTNLATTIAGDYLTRDKWHSVVDVIEYTEEGAKCTMYLDGNVYGETDRLIETKKTKDGEVQQFGGSIFNQIRLSVVTGDLMDTSSFYMDDIIVYETDEAFVPESLTLPDDFGVKYEIVDGDKLYIKDNAQITVAEVKDKIPNAVTIRNGEELSDDAVIAKGDVIRYKEIENYVKELSGYRALVICGDIFGNDNFKMYKYDGSTTVSAGDKVKVRAADGGIVVAAGYDAEGALTGVVSEMTASDGYTEVLVPEGNKVAFMAVDDIASLKPVCGKYEIVFPEAE